MLGPGLFDENICFGENFVHAVAIPLLAYASVACLAAIGSGFERDEEKPLDACTSLLSDDEIDEESSVMWFHA